MRFLNKGFDNQRSFFKLLTGLLLVAVVITTITLAGVFTPTNLEAELVEGVNYNVQLHDGVGTNDSVKP